MIVGGYALELYCDTEGCPMAGSFGIVPPPLCNEFTGEFGSECRREAREYGWKLDLSTGECWCPWCTGRMDKPKRFAMTTIADGSMVE
jgi:hypothetical protein